MILYQFTDEIVIKDILSNLEPVSTVSVGTDLRKIQSLLSEKTAMIVIDEKGRMLGSISAKKLWEQK